MRGPKLLMLAAVLVVRVVSFVFSRSVDTQLQLYAISYIGRAVPTCIPGGGHVCCAGTWLVGLLCRPRDIYFLPVLFSCGIFFGHHSTCTFCRALNWHVVTEDLSC